VGFSVVGNVQIGTMFMPKKLREDMVALARKERVKAPSLFFFVDIRINSAIPIRLNKFTVPENRKL